MTACKWRLHDHAITRLDRPPERMVNRRRDDHALARQRKCLDRRSNPLHDIENYPAIGGRGCPPVMVLIPRPTGLDEALVIVAVHVAPIAAGEKCLNLFDNDRRRRKIHIRDPGGNDVITKFGPFHADPATELSQGWFDHGKSVAVGLSATAS